MDFYTAWNKNKYLFVKQLRNVAQKLWFLVQIIQTMKKAIYLIILFTIGLTGQVFSQAPPMQLPRASQAATSYQKVGLVEIEIKYSRPGVKDREIFGNLIPYDQVWRAGANENTTVSFSHPVKVGGEVVPAGTYGLHIIPTEAEWTLILNSNHNSWGSFFYDESKDVARVNGRPSSMTETQEWLAYDFSELTDHSCNIVMRWANTKVSFPIEMSTVDLMMDYIENEYLTGIPGFLWDGYNNAALYCARQGVEFEKAMGWVDESIRRNKNFSNLSTKYLILKKTGKNEEASKLLAEAMPMGQENEVNNFGYVMMGEGDLDVALKLFKYNTEQHPDSWNVWDSLGEAYAKKGEKTEAIKNYKKAKKMATDENQKKRIEKILSDLAA